MKNWQKKTLACLLGLLLLCGGTQALAAGVKGAPAQSQTTHTEARQKVRPNAPHKVTAEKHVVAARAQAKPVKAAEAKTVKGAVQAAGSENTEKDSSRKASTIKENAARTEPVTLRPTGNQPLIAVGLARGVNRAVVTGNGPFSVYSGTTKWKSYKAGERLTLTVRGRAIYLDGKAVGETVIIQPEGLTLLSYDDSPYRGSLRLQTATGNGMVVVNDVPVESYLYGVVPREMPASWEMNALRAQAVAARTYALAHRGDYRSQGFDVLPTVLSQVYGGVAAEDPRSTQAVNDTAGEVLTYNGHLIDAVFCAHSGGYTEDSENVWTNRVPYLRSVVEPTNDFTEKQWSVRLSLRELEAKLAASGRDVGQIRKIRLSPLGKAPYRAKDRTAAGRVKEIVFEGTKKTVTVTGNRFQELLELRSTLFDIRLMKKGDQVEVYGYGYGHGVGMSQWGAQIMAQKNSQDKLGYRKILLHFYSGVKLETMY